MKVKALSEEACAGLSAGIVGTVLGYPLDVIKTRKQTSTSLSTTSKGIISTSLYILRNEGIMSFYKGIGPPLVSLSILNTFNFATYSFLQEQVNATRGKWDIRNGIAGAIVGPGASMISTVENFVKTQMQIDTVAMTKSSSARQFNSSWDCITKLVRANGLSVLYTGHIVNTTRESTFLLSYFYMYEGLRNEFIQLATMTASSKETSSDSINESRSSSYHKWAIPMAGGISGAIAWAVSFPLDLIRARIQGNPVSVARISKDEIVHTNHQRQLRLSVYQIFVQLIQQKGIGGLYTGVTPSIVRAFVVSGSRFSAYEGALWILRGGRDIDRHAIIS
jgi:solute carrier family 25 (mitochondrial carnitine/acylcarnitine transporter), member 20/29